MENDPMMPQFQRLLVLGALCTLGACHTDVPEPPRDPGLVALSGDLGETLLRAERGGEVLARLRITGGAIEGNARPPLNLALVLDTSGSMRGEAIEKLKLATAEILSMLRPDDAISIVTFGSEVDVLVESQTAQELDGSALAGSLDSLQAEGTTNLAGGLARGLAQIRVHQTAESIDWIVLLGDGVPNDPDAVWPVTEQAKRIQVHIAALGLGLDFDAVLMGEIAQRTHGLYEYVETPSQVAQVFRGHILRLNRLVARNMTLVVRPGPGVELLEIVGHSAPEGGGALQLELGDLAEGETRELVVRITAPGRREGAYVELIDAVVSFHDPINVRGLRRNVFLGAPASASEDAVVASRNEEVFELALQMQAASNTVAAIRLLNNGRSAEAHALLRSVGVDEASYARPGRGACARFGRG